MSGRPVRALAGDPAQARQQLLPQPRQAPGRCTRHPALVGEGVKAGECVI